METPYLIQRGKIQKKGGKGIDTLLQFDYMGSSEFEWGALPKSMDRIRKNEIEYDQFECILTGFEDKPIMVLCKESDKEELPKILAQLAAKELRLKEYCDLNEYLQGHANYRTSDFWWDIVNDYFLLATK